MTSNSSLRQQSRYYSVHESIETRSFSQLFILISYPYLSLRRSQLELQLPVSHAQRLNLSNFFSTPNFLKFRTLIPPDSSAVFFSEYLLPLHCRYQPLPSSSLFRLARLLPILFTRAFTIC